MSLLGSGGASFSRSSFTTHTVEALGLIANCVLERNSLDGGPLDDVPGGCFWLSASMLPPRTSRGPIARGTVSRAASLAASRPRRSAFWISSARTLIGR
jgi:hypothetical protein